MATTFLNKQTDFINNTVKFRMDNAYDQYSLFLDKMPITITYFKQDKIASTFDLGHGTRDSKIGDSSPIRYKRITNVPLYMEQNQLDYDFDEEKGIHVDWSSEGIMLPNVIEPVADDLFVIEYFSEKGQKKLLFKITSVQADYIKSNNYYKIEFKYDKYVPEELENQIVEDYKCIFDNIGTDKKSVVKLQEYIDMESLYSIKNDIINNVINLFFINQASVFAFTDNMGSFYYDPYLLEFVSENHLFLDSNSNVALVHTIPVSKYFDIKFKNTLYYKLMKQSFKPWSDKFGYFPCMHQNNYFANAGYSVFTLEYYNSRIDNADWFADGGNFSFTYEDVLDETKDGFMPTLIRNFFNNKTKENITLLNDEEILVYPDRDGLYDSVIIVFIINSIIDNMTKKEKDIIMT